MNVGKVLGGVAVVGVLGLGGLAAVVAMQPATTHIERSLLVNAAPADVFPLVNDFRHWVVWNPWQDMDPSQKTTVSEDPIGVGAWYTWEGNDQVGKGKMSIVESVEPTKIVEQLEFIEPFQSKADITFTFAPEGAGTKVVWAYDAENDFMTKAFGLVMDMDAMLGADFEKGLARLAPAAEKLASERIAAEAAAKAAAEAAAVAAAEAGGAAAAIP